MIIDFRHAKKVATGCLAMTSCAFFLWVNQNNIQADTNQQPVTQVTQPLALPVNQSADQSMPQVNPNDQGNYAWLDHEQIDNDGYLNVSGWHATNASESRNYHYIIAYDRTDNTEIARQNVTNDSINRTDVARIYPVYGAANSGFSARFNLNAQLAGSGQHQIQVLSRYTSDPAGNGDAVDYWFAPITIDRNNHANLDTAYVNEQGQLEVKGWNATNLAVNKPTHMIIIYDRTSNREVSRTVVQPVARPDVAKVYPGVDGAGQSGFDAKFSLDGINFSHQLQVISRYTSSTNGNSDYVDYWFAPITNSNAANQGYLDNINLSDGRHLLATGWHVDDLARFEPNRFVILFDRTSNSQVAVVKAPVVSRPDVARVFPNITGSDQSGFKVSFDLSQIKLTPGHTYAVVSRYSTSDTGNGGQGQYSDFWSAPFNLNQKASYIDHIEMTKEGLQVAGWMISDYRLQNTHPYLIVLNNGKEVARQKLTLTNRSDVAKAYGQIYGSAQSGFSTLVSLDPNEMNGTTQVILRFSDDPAGNGNFDDQYSPNYASNNGHFDKINVNNEWVYVSGWHASNQAINKPYQYLIFVDQDGHELYRQEVLDKNRARKDVAQAEPAIYNSGNSGYQLGFRLPSQLNHHMVRIIHRFTDDKNGNGNAVDYWSGLVSINAMRTPIDYRQPSEYFAYPNLSQLNNFWIHVRIGQNRVYLMNGNDVVYTMYCTAGYYDHGVSTTPTGTYYIQAERGNSFYNGALGEGANYWTSFLNHGEYLFHTVPTDRYGNYKPYEASQLGINQGSHGCIRLSIPDAYWIMHNVPTGTRVVIDN